MAQSDLIISDIDVGSQDISFGETVSEIFAPGQTFTVTVAVKNQGTGSAGSSTAAAYMNINGSLVRLDTNSTGSLAAGSINTGEALTFTIPADIAEGTYAVLVTADYGNSVQELDENNNATGFYINVRKPDLVISDVDVGSQDISFGETVSGNFTAGETFTVTTSIKNQGDGPAELSAAAAYMNIDGSLVRLDTNSTSSLSPGDTDGSEDLTFTIPADLASGKYAVLVTTDYEGEISESNEDNNATGFYINVVQGTPNLLVEDVSVGGTAVSPNGLVPGEYRAGDTFTVTFDVRNDGTGAALASSAAVFMAINGTLVRLDTEPVSSLGGGAQDTGETLSFTIPSGLSAGQHPVLIVADWDVKVTESDETDNNFGFFLNIVEGGSTEPSDFVREGTATTAVLTEGVWLDGTIDAEPVAGDEITSDLAGGFVDKDWYRAALLKGANYRFEVEDLSLTTGLAAIQLYDQNGNAITGTLTSGASPSIDFSTAGQPSDTQTYFIAISASDTNDSDFRTATGDFRLRFSQIGSTMADTVREGTDTAATLSVGGAVNGTIDQNGIDGADITIDKDWYRVDLVAGQTYNFSGTAGLSSLDTLDALALRLYSSDNTAVTSIADAASPSLSYTAAASGAYYLAVSAGGSGEWQDKTGGFRISATKAAPTATTDTVREGTDTTSTLSVGGTVNGTIDQNGIDGTISTIDKDWHRVTLQGGTAYKFGGTANVSTTDTLNDIAIRLYWDDRTVASQLIEGASPELTFMTPGSGPVTAYLAVSAGGSGDWTDDTGAYRLDLSNIGEAPPVNYAPIAHAQNQTAVPGTPIPLSALFSFSDPNGSGDIARFAVQDRTDGSGHLTFDGVQQDANHIFERPISELSRWSFVAGAGQDQIGFNAIDHEGAFNSLAVATVSPEFPGVPPADLEQLDADALFDMGNGKLTTLAMFAHAAYDDNSKTLDKLESFGWQVLDAKAGLPNMTDRYYDKTNSGLGFPFGEASAIVAESEDRASLVISLRGTDFKSTDPADWTAIKEHSTLFYPLLDALNQRKSLDEYDNIYITGHSLGAGAAQAVMLDERYSLFSDTGVEAMVFANPGYTHLGPWQSRFVNIAIEGDPVAELGMLGRTVGDTYILDHTLPWSLDWHGMDWYLAGARYVADTSAVETIDRQMQNRQSEMYDIRVRLEIRDGREWIGHLEYGSSVTPGGVEQPVEFGLDLPAVQWAVSVDDSTAGTTPIVFDAPQYTNTSFEISATSAGEVLLEDATDVPLFIASEFTSLVLNAGIAGVRFIVGGLASTDILDHTVYFNGNIGNDVLAGADADRRIVAHGGAGDDLLVGGLSNDLLDGGAGHDTISGRDGSDTVSAGDGDDVVIGGPGSNTLRGQGGVDRLIGSKLHDELSGGIGDDSLEGLGGDDTILGQDGLDVILGGGGADTLRGGTGDDRIEGSAGPDELLGQGHADILEGRAGNDLLRGGSGDDILSGGSDDDQLYGQGNNDVLYGSGGNDHLNGAAGLDSLSGGAGDDTLTAGDGSDHLDGGPGNDLMNGGSQPDTFHFDLGYDSDTISAFVDDSDTIEISAALAAGRDAQGIIADFATASVAATVFDFGNGDMLRVVNMAAVDLVDDIVVA